MYLKLLIGPKQGEVRFFSPESARALLANGRAVKAFTEPGPPATDPNPPAQPREAVAPVSDAGKTAGHDAHRQGGKRK